MDGTLKFLEKFLKLFLLISERLVRFLNVLQGNL